MRTGYITFLLAFVTGFGTLSAEKVRIGDLYYNLDTENLTAEVTFQVKWPDKSNYDGLISVVIPSSVTCDEQIYSVTSIGEYAFSGSLGLSSVTIPNSIKSIGNLAFFCCGNLDSLHISGVSEWCGMSFDYSSGLSVFRINHLCVGDEEITELIIPDGVTNIRQWVFSGCVGLTSVFIPGSVTTIDEGAFDYCIGITSFTISDGVTSIGQRAFSQCVNLHSVVIPASVTNIGNGAFYRCYGLTSVTLPGSVTQIGSRTFLECRSLTSVYNYATTPQTIRSDSFRQDYLSDCTLYVPEQSVSLYQSEPIWSEFGNILALPQSMASIITPQSDASLRKQLINGQLLILRNGKIYTIQGLEIR